MAFIAILGVLIIIVGLTITAAIFFIISRDEKKKLDRDKDILDS